MTVVVIESDTGRVVEDYFVWVIVDRTAFVFWVGVLVEVNYGYGSGIGPQDG